MFLGYDPVGKTLLQVCVEAGSWYAGGVEVLILQDDEDTNGKSVACEFSLWMILHEHPLLNNAIVKYTNEFFGTTVYRVRLE